MLSGRRSIPLSLPPSNDHLSCVIVGFKTQPHVDNEYSARVGFHSDRRGRVKLSSVTRIDSHRRAFAQAFTSRKHSSKSLFYIKFFHCTNFHQHGQPARDTPTIHQTTVRHQQPPLIKTQSTPALALSVMRRNRSLASQESLTSRRTITAMTYATSVTTSIWKPKLTTRCGTKSLVPNVQFPCRKTRSMYYQLH
jgi:hypothetical protein